MSTFLWVVIIVIIVVIIAAVAYYTVLKDPFGINIK